MTSHQPHFIRNSTAEFLIFTGQSGQQGIEARYEDETIWLTQKLMAALFDVGVNTINYHLKEIFESNEIQPEATIRKYRIVQQEGIGRWLVMLIISTSTPSFPWATG